MDETIASIISKITVKFPQPTRVPGGHLCSEFYDCSHLVPNDLARLAAYAVGHLPDDSFDVALGLAYSGILFASAVAGGRQVNIFQKDGEIYGHSIVGKRVLLVDDVIASGAHMSVAENKVEALGGIVVGYAAIVDRSAGRIGSNDKPVWSALQAGI